MTATREIVFEIALNPRERKALERLLEGKLKVLKEAKLIAKVERKP